MRKVLMFLFCSMTALLSGCGAQEVPFEQLPKTDPALLWKYAEKSVSFSGRYSGSESILRYGDWIRDTAKASKYAVTEQRFREMTPGGELPFRNIVVTVPGKSSSFVIVGAHYDAKKFLTIKDFQAANDGASGVAVLLGMIDSLRKYGKKPPVGIRFIFFDGEECQFDYKDNDGLHGSKKAASLWAENGDLRKCKGLILLDMVGEKDLNFTLPKNTSKVFLDAFMQIVQKDMKNISYKLLPYEMLDDHVPFLQKNIPVIDLIDFEYGPNNSYWHTSGDTLDKLSPESMALSGNLAFALIWKAARF